MPQKKSLHMDSRGWILLIILALIWGGSFLFGRVAVQEIPPLTLVMFRVFIAAAALHFYLIAKRTPFKASGSLLAAFLMMGLLNNIIPFSLIFYGQQEIGAGLAAVINAMTPIWTLLIAHQFTSDERLSATKFFGIALGFVGVAVLIGPDALNGLSGSTLAMLAVLGGTISYGCAGVFGKRFASLDPIQSSTGQLSMSCLLILPLVMLFDGTAFLNIPSQTTIWSVIALAIACTAFAYVLFFKILKIYGAVNVSLVTLLVPVSALILGTILLNERLNLMQFAGMMLILAGLLVIDGRLFKRRIV